MRRFNVEGSIYKLGCKRRKPWAVRITVGWTIEGKQQYKYLGYYPTKTEAKNALREYLLKPYDLTNKDVTQHYTHKNINELLEEINKLKFAPNSHFYLF